MLREIVEGFEPTNVSAGPAKIFGDISDGTIQFPGITQNGVVEVSYFYGDGKPKNIIVISSQTGCHYGCNFCELGKEKPIGNIDLSPDEIYEQAILILQKALQFGFDIDTIAHKVTVANTGEPLFNPNLISGLERITQLGTSFKVSTIFPPGRKARKNFENLAEFASGYQRSVQLQISLISTSEDYRRKAAGVKLASFEEIKDAADYWRKLNPQRKVNLSLILTADNPCNVDDVYDTFPPELFRFRLRPYVQTENGKRNLLVRLDYAELDRLKESFKQRGYEVGDWAKPTPVEQKFGLAGNVTRGRYLRSKD